MASMLDMGSKEMGIDFKKEPLSLEELMRFNFLSDYYTWSPGDQDSKPNMTPELLKIGIKRNRMAMQQHYTLKLADIIVKMEEDRDQKGLPKTVPDGIDIHGPGNEKYRTQVAIDRMKALARHLMRQVGDKEYTKYLNEGINTIGGVKDTTKQLLNDLYNHRNTPDEILDAAKQGEEIELGTELANIRELKGVNYPLYEAYNTTPPTLSMVDVLMVQAFNYGERALRVQVRQNKDMHRKVLTSILEKFEDRNELEPILSELTKRKVLPESFKSLQDLIIQEGDQKGELIESIRKPMVEILLEQLHNPKTAAPLRVVMQSILSDAQDQKSSIESAITTQDQELKNGITNKEAHDKNVKKLEKELTKPRDLFNTLASFKLAAENPEAIPQYLIAECADSNDVLDAFFMLRAMGPEKVIGKGVEIVPLLEHRDPVLNMGNIIKESYANKYFAEYHHQQTEPLDPAINRYTPDTPRTEMPSTRNVMWTGSTPLTTDPLELPYSPLTVAQAKIERGIEPKEGDEKRIVKSKKIIMGAGSDLLKSASPAGAALLQKTFEKTYGDMLDMDPPVLLVDYTGSGGGAHRSQPVMALIETIQGRSLRSARSSHASKMQQVLSQRVSQQMGIFGNKLEADEQKIVMRLNMGNIAGLPLETQNMWDRLEPKLMNWSNAYQDWYKSPDIKLLLNDSAANYVGITSYADRPQKRVDSQTEGLDPEKMRAIGFGASFNHSGSCATMYFGASKFFYSDPTHSEMDAKELKTVLELYKASPKAQDAINRATLGIANADMDTAWAFLGAQREYKNGSVSITVTNGGKESHTYSLNELLSTSQVPANLRAMAMVENEYQRVSKALIQINRELNGKVMVDKQKDLDTEPSQLLLNELPSVLQDQIRETRKVVDPQRKELARIHQQYKQSGEPLPKRGDKKNPDYKRVYYAMATCYEHFEHIPSSMLRVDWALNAEKQAQTQRAA